MLWYSIGDLEDKRLLKWNMIYLQSLAAGLMAARSFWYLILLLRKENVPPNPILDVRTM